MAQERLVLLVPQSGAADLLFCLALGLFCMCVRQVEFYFSDSNIPKDKFLLDQVNKHPEGCE